MIGTVAVALATQTPVQTNLDTLVKRHAANGSLIGVEVTSTSGQTLYEHMADFRLVPASNQKILSNVFAFESLGSNHRFETKFWRDGDNVWVQASGDQTITASDLTKVKQTLGVSGEGLVYVQQPYQLDAGPGWESDDLDFRYAPRLTGFSVDRAQFQVLNSGGIPIVPAWTGIQITHVAASKPMTVSFDRIKGRITVRGKIDPKATSLATFALPNPDRAAARILGRTMIPVDHLPSRQPDHIHQSLPLKEVAKLCLEPSDNLIAESLYLAASESGSYAKAQAAMTKCFTEVIKLPAGSVRPDDGSGLSRHNFVTARAMAQLLRHAYQSPYRDDFIRALPAQGEGTMGNRLKGVRFAAKTGTLDAVSCLSGYVWIRNDEPVIFSVLMNHHIISASQARQLQDSIVQEVIRSLASG
jgi:D-alanyl-D-alanine carboxypeptidase/D-alanyl-D-alanine-endopeptidase (penicillin-binding protein 4)